MALAEDGEGGGRGEGGGGEADAGGSVEGDGEVMRGVADGVVSIFVVVWLKPMHGPYGLVRALAHDSGFSWRKYSVGGS